jgi:hypothetical protein
MNHTLYSSQKYRKFTNDRNKVLEQINLNAQTDISRMLFSRLDDITGFVSRLAIEGKMSLTYVQFITKNLNHYIEVKFANLIPLIVYRLSRMRKSTYIISYLGELEAIARATKKTKYIMPHDFKYNLNSYISPKSLTLNQKTWDIVAWTALEKLKHRIVQKMIQSVFLDKTPQEIVEEVKKAYPSILSYKRPPKVLKNVKEAAGDKPGDKKEFDFYSSLITDSDWNSAVQAYKNTELPASRFDDEARQFDPEVGYSRYNWELEQDMTDDFVKTVRDSQRSAGKELGIKDFVWVAVIDNKTCDNCCLPRNGLTLSEIESRLNSGELSEDDCDATSPPAHFHCRCDLAPVASVDEVEGPDWKSFDDWLES